MSLYEELLECVIDDDSEVIRESVLNKAGLNKEDLRDPEKVKKALKNLNGITSEYEKRSAIINIISSVIQTINALISITGKFSTEGKIAQALSILVVQTITEIAKYHLGVSDYRKLINKIDTQINKISKKIEKLNKDDKDHKEEIKQLEEIRNNLKRSKGEVMKRMREENKIEGKEEEINHEAEHPMSAFTDMIK